LKNKIVYQKLRMKKALPVSHLMETLNQ